MNKHDIEYYINILKKHNLLIQVNNINDVKNSVLENITFNSKEVIENTMFICKGKKFRKEYLNEALKKGAIVYVSELIYTDTPSIIVSDIRRSMAILALEFFNYPNKDINMIGITGTKGKSTTAIYTKEILNNYNHHVGLLSSLYNFDGKEKEESNLTTPEAINLISYIAKMKDNKVNNLVMEVSSQALKYNRVYGIEYKIGVFTNISIDHISPIEHPDFDDYFNSKLKLIKNCKTAIINYDMDYVEQVIKSVSNNSSIITYSLKNKMATYYAYDIKRVSYDKYQFKVKSPKFDEVFTLGMVGLFNISNALASIAIADSLGVPLNIIKKTLDEVKVPGRMEIYKKDDTIAIVDYAHNKLSLESLFKTVKKDYPHKDIIAVFGCPGDKALVRRKDMGQLANKYAKFTFLTMDDPGSEDVNNICKEIALNINANKYEIIEDRQRAIQKALRTYPNHVIVIAGKGNEIHQKSLKLEDYQGDAAIVKEVFKEELIEA